MQTRPQLLWKKVRNLIRANNNWKKVRNELLLYGTQNYEFKPTFNVLTFNEQNILEKMRKQRQFKNSNDKIQDDVKSQSSQNNLNNNVLQRVKND